ncbi:SprT family zinc-dependent metalloprotease [Aeromonas caviae]|uniref:Protein SprT n=1 Tax=Aeromonas caviae TaxID=648 RepID=A0A443VXL3_AERCA|nr:MULTISPECIES: SprT family zinc-dependent metalloprotease [Aeromonas]MBL0530994.1 SprT family zinc-dependent metalloprotease [Aeromonas caviae]MBL0587447.1 SprT family zinc-dependent metalloprotease [Aeromonas caviae]MCX4047825.1 SprT family zinc-dependent metalloprotease [Aeromonas caviae]MCX4106896.1 SprT family zinc-dependent metalloprotease [Aeromonas caviae]MCY9812896.1 SprT family zinc-dependent metalloprotease [Aeromonas caviae]
MPATATRLDPALIETLLARVDACFVQAETRLGRTFPRPQVHCNMRGRAAGSARLQTWELRFNPALYQANQQAFLREVVPHEVAHLLVYALWGEGRGKSRVLPHGRQWQSVMRELFGLEPSTTHSFDLGVLAQRTFVYACACQQHPLSVRRHNKVMRGEARYHCRRCRQPLVWQRDTTAD